MVASSSESRVNPVDQFLKKHNPFDKVPPENTDVFQVCNVCEVIPCEVFISQLVLKTMQLSLQLESSCLKLKNTSVGSEDELWKLSQSSESSS